MASEYVTRWLEKRIPDSNIDYRGMDAEGLHVWDVDVLGTGHTVKVGIPDEVADDDALLSERLAELDTQGWIDQAGEDKDIWVLLAPRDIRIAGEPW
jgi:hypothetical protein